MSSEHTVRRACGGLAVFAGGAFVIYSLQVAYVQAGYHALKYGNRAAQDVERKAVFAERMYRGYPRHYYLCLLMADELVSKAVSGERAASAALETQAITWCERGLLLNPHRRELVWMQVMLSGLHTASAATAIWERYVANVFWNPWNLAAMVRLYADAGRVEEAMAVLILLQGRPEYAWAAAAVEHARLRMP